MKNKIIQFPKPKVLTGLELRCLSDRIDEIDEIFETYPELDDDIHENLMAELDSIIETIEKSVTEIQRRERIEKI